MDLFDVWGSSFGNMLRPLWIWNTIDYQFGGADKAYYKVVELDELLVAEGRDELDELVVAKGHDELNELVAAKDHIELSKLVAAKGHDDLNELVAAKGHDELNELIAAKGHDETFVLIHCQFGGSANIVFNGNNRHINQLKRFIVNGVWSK